MQDTQLCAAEPSESVDRAKSVVAYRTLESATFPSPAALERQALVAPSMDIRRRSASIDSRFASASQAASSAAPELAEE